MSVYGSVRRHCSFHRRRQYLENGAPRDTIAEGDDDAGLVCELASHRADGIAAAEAKPSDVRFMKIVRLKGEQEIGLVAPLGIRGVMPLEDGLHPAQTSVVGEKMRQAHHEAKRLAWGGDGWGAAGDESTETALSNENSGFILFSD